MAERPFTVLVNEDALNVALRDRTEKPQALVQGIVDEYFSSYEATARVELTSRLALAFDAADEGTRKNVAGMLGVVIDVAEFEDGK